MVVAEQREQYVNLIQSGGDSLKYTLQKYVLFCLLQAMLTTKASRKWGFSARLI